MVTINRRHILITAAAAALVTTGAAVATEVFPLPDDVAQNAPAEVGGAEVAVDQVGHVLKDLAEPGGLVDPDDSSVVFEIAVTDVARTATCPSRDGSTAEAMNGEFLVLTVDASLDASYAEADPNVEDPFMPLIPDLFLATDADGVEIDSHSDASWVCYGDELLQPFLDPGTTATGLVVLDVPAGAERVVYDPEGTGGWSWAIP